MDVRGEWLGDVVKASLRDAAAQGLLDAAELVKERSVAVAPKEFGELSGSADADVDKRTLISAISYQTERFPKLYKQHEDLTYHHPSGEQAKFLEEPLYAAASSVQSILAAALDRGLR